jgi:YHS domain-containing protein
MLTRRSLIGLLATAPFLTRPALAASPDFFAEGGLAIRGADPVAFFTNGAPTSGVEAHSLMWKGATWRFASAENMALFEANPEAYAPQYGGYCAFAMSKGAIATSVPEAWTIVDGKLYLNYSLNVRTIWSEDIPGNIERANGHWPDILNL